MDAGRYCFILAAAVPTSHESQLKSIKCPILACPHLPCRMLFSTLPTYSCSAARCWWHVPLATERLPVPMPLLACPPPLPPSCSLYPQPHPQSSVALTLPVLPVARAAYADDTELRRQSQRAPQDRPVRALTSGPTPAPIPDTEPPSVPRAPSSLPSHCPDEGSEPPVSGSVDRSEQALHYPNCTGRWMHAARALVHVVRHDPHLPDGTLPGLCVR